MDSDIIDELIPHVIMEDIPEQYHDIVNAIGIPNTIQLLKVIGGLTIYLPLPELLLKPARNRMIIKENKGNCRELALKYGISDTAIRRILANKEDK